MHWLPDVFFFLQLHVRLKRLNAKVTGYTSELLNAVSSCSPSSVEDVLTRGQEPRFSSMEVMCSGSFFTRHSWGKEVRHS